MRYTIITVLSIIALIASGLEGNLHAREWSNEVRMTYVEEDFLYTANSIVMDADDIIHIFYGILRCQNEDYNRTQPVYQKFNNHGEPLSDPLLIEDIVDLPDSIIFRGYDLFIDNNENTYLLWGENLHSDKDAHVTIFDSGGELVNSDIALEGVTAYSINSTPKIAVDSQGNIIYAGELINFNLPGYGIFYSRYTSEGDMIDTVHVIADNWARDFYLEIDSQDNLHIVWKVHGVNQHYSVHYTKVSPDDELLIDNYSLPSIVGREDELHIIDFKLNNTDSPLFLLMDVEDGDSKTYLTEYGDDMDTCFVKYIGLTGYLTNGFIDVDSLNNIHTIATFDDEELDHDRIFIGYEELDENGEIIDSLQIVHDASMSGNAGRRADWAGVMFVFVSNNGTISVIWVDERHYEGGYNEAGHEYYMRYSENDNYIINQPQINPPSSLFLLSPNYPNPFNNMTYIPFYTNMPGNYSLSIFNIQGRFIYSNMVNVQKTGQYLFSWNGLDYCGRFAPNGTYLALIESTFFKDSQKIVYLR
ncbi:T9SS type A sorting domain-containing protein [bacterium]|nr:T9SS type A sorting domain-containing protein [bacterium]